MNNLITNIIGNKTTAVTTPTPKESNVFSVGTAVSIVSGIVGFGVSDAYYRYKYKPNAIKIVKESRIKFSQMFVKKMSHYVDNIEKKALVNADWEKAIKAIAGFRKAIIKDNKKIHAIGLLTGLAIGLSGFLLKNKISPKD